jgi:hypothetical protein
VTVVLGVPTYKRYDLLVRLVETTLAGSMVPDRIVVVDNGCRFDEAYKGPMERVEVIRPGRNLGCAGGWNAIMRAAEAPDDVMIVSNDDIAVAPDGVQAMVEAARGAPTDAMVLGYGYSLFACMSRLWRTVGAFDERIWPAYFEDNDYTVRLKLAGVPSINLPACGSHAGSQTLLAMSRGERGQHHAQFKANRFYYMSKWGGGPGAERHQEPGVNTRGSADMNLEELYFVGLRQKTDIHQHLPVLRALAAQVEHVTEFGVRTGQSTTALLAAQPKVLKSYDIADLGVAAKLRPLQGRTDFTFTVADTRAITIEPTDLLFIDTLHTYDQLKEELRLHGDKARRWIVMHDTTTFGDSGEVPGTRGLWAAVEEFVAQGAFVVKERRTNNNGLTVLERM